MTQLEKVALINFIPHSDPRGHLVAVQSNQDVPFSIARIFYIYGAPMGCVRGNHASRESEQVITAIAGNFALELTDGQQSRTYVMNDPARGVYIPPMIWLRMHNFSDDAVCLVLTSSFYDFSDYSQDWDQYLSAAGKLKER